MSAVESFEEWSDRVDELTAGGSDVGSSRGGDAVEPAGGWPAPDYGPDVLAAIEAQDGEPAPPVRHKGGWRGGAAAGAMVVGLVQGVRDVLDDEAEPLVEIDRERRDRSLEAVSVHLVWGDPAAGVAVVRRWLL